MISDQHDIVECGTLFVFGGEIHSHEAHCIATGLADRYDGVPRTRAYLVGPFKTGEWLVKRYDDRGLDDDLDAVLDRFDTFEEARAYAIRNVRVRERWKARPGYATRLKQRRAALRAEMDAEIAAEAAAQLTVIPPLPLSPEAARAYVLCLDGVIRKPTGA